MLFILGLLLLLTPFPSFQTTTNEKRNSTGSDMTKPNAIFTLSKPKTTASLAKQILRPTLKPNTVNQTVLPTSSTNQKPPTANAPKTTRGKFNPTVIQTTLSAPARPTTASSIVTTKDKLALSANQTVITKSPSTSEVKTAKDKPAPTVVQNVQSTSTKATSTRSSMATKNKLTASVNQTVLIKSPSTGDVKMTKDKPAPTVVQAVLSTPVKAATASSTMEKDKVTASVSQTSVIKSPTTSVVKTTKDKPASAQPIKVIVSDGCDSSQTKEQELKLKPGSPLVMTHKISLVPGGCSGGCEAEMAALKGRVARLEREMSSLKEKCPCSANCPNDCNGNGKCERGKCVCVHGFVGPDCSKCAPGADCSKKTAKGKVKISVETVTLHVNQDSNTIKENTQGKNNKVEHTLFQKKDQKKGTEGKETDTRPKGSSNEKVGIIKTVAKQGPSANKKIIKSSTSATKTSHPTVGQVLLKHEGRKQEEARKGKTTVLTSKKVLPKTGHKIFSVKEGAADKVNTKSTQLKDQPQTNITQSNVKKSGGTANVLTILTKVTGTNKTRAGKEMFEQSTLAEKNVTRSSGHKVIKRVKVENVNGTKVVQSVDTKNTEAGKIGSGIGKVIQRSQYLVNTTIAVTSDETKVHQTPTDGHTSGNTTRRAGGTGLGSVRVANISSYSFTLTWSAPHGMFKNFTVIRREQRAEDEEDEEVEEAAFEGDRAAASKNTTEVQIDIESTNGTASSAKVLGSRSKAESRRVSMVLPGSVRSVEFGNLRPLTRYVLYIYGTALGKRSKIHRVAVSTGPEPPAELVFSNVTESSVSLSWSKPKTTFTGYRVTYTNSVTGESRYVTMSSQQSHIVLSKLSAGSTYIISITTTQGKVQSDVLTSTITTVPAPPTHLQAVNITDTRAVLQWTPSLGKVDRFIISYESSKTPNVTVTVMVSGNSMEHQLRGLQRGTLYTVKALSQKDSLQSTAISATFTTANVVKAGEVTARSAVIAWKAPTVVFHSYRLIYQVIGEEPKELILDPTITEYKLTGLLSMSRYIVLVQGERDGQYTSIVTTEFFTGKLRFPFPTECSQELLNGALQSGEVDIYPKGREGGAVRVYCDMETDGGGWTVFQRRMNGKTDFYRTWSEYRAGFGNLSEEFWLGNELLHNLTNVGPVSLRVDMRAGNDTAYAHYSNFTIDSEEKHYTITVSGYTGTAGDSMRYHNGRPFSTRDKDPDPLGIHCARAYMGGWWYKNCYKTNLNGLFGINSNNQGVVWIDWRGKDSSIPFAEMKFRPSGFSPATHG
ncbi:tenascin [Myripristis murdjan]|uniref:tenascin n=1 Tax=Myripristis murdjan TaxID=586833 RepID=UPI0011761B79|nr:tenascin-like [Myripristis murdjan]